MILFPSRRRTAWAAGLTTAALWLVLCPTAHSQQSERLSLDAEVQAFFQNNEYFGPHAEGYTLPGFSLRPRLRWIIDPEATLEAGVSMLHFWGANGFPEGRINEVWPAEADSLSQRSHIRPWLRAKISIGHGFALTLGNISVADSHLLPLPLYNPERLYATDPEAGLQAQYKGRFFSLDLWTAWQEYIWRQSRRQEKFLFGLSAVGRLPLHSNPFADTASAPWTLRLPLHFLAQHSGGQALAVPHSVLTRLNAAAGLGLVHSHAEWEEQATVYALLYHQNRPTAAHFEQGTALYASAQLIFRQRASIEAGYLRAHQFESLLGSPLFCTLPPQVSERAQTHHVLTAAVRYTYRTPSLSALHIDGRVYLLPLEEKKLQYSFGIFIDLNPRLTLIR